MISLWTTALHPRLAYAAQLVFELVLRTPYEWIAHPDGRHPDSRLLVWYGPEPRKGCDLWIPDAGFWAAQPWKEQDIPVSPRRGIPWIFGVPEPRHWPQDLFAAVFWLATEYERWHEPHLDHHGRYQPRSYRRYQEGWTQWPLVHLYAAQLWARITQLAPALRRSARTFSYQLTFDIDHPWKHRHKPLWISLGGMAQSLLRLDGAGISERIRALVHKKDPNDTFDWIFSHCDPGHTHFFLLTARRAPQDGRHTLQTRAYGELIRQMAAHGYAIGIHPSYLSYDRPDQIAEESQALAQFLGQPITASRQHFLRYALPDTFRHLQAAGIQDEFTLCAYEKGGFPTGLALPYPWFDLDRNTATGLTLHPTLLMDVTLPLYMKLSPESGLAHAQELIRQTREVNGHFTLLLHNDCLSESGYWRGWRPVFEEIIHTLQTHGSPDPVEP